MIIIRNAAVALEARPWLETLPASGLRSGTFRPTRSSCSEVVPQPLRPGLANVELRADRADRRNAMRCQLIGEYLGCLFTERVPGHPHFRLCRQVQAEKPRITIMSSS